MLSGDGTIYQGNWIEDKKNGFGIETYVDSSVYSGYFKDDIK